MFVSDADVTILTIVSGSIQVHVRQAFIQHSFAYSALSKNICCSSHGLWHSLAVDSLYRQPYLQFQVRCTRVKVKDASQVELYRLPSSMRSFNYTDLQPPMEYKCTINASTNTGTGPTAYLLAWTEAIGRNALDTSKKSFTKSKMSTDSEC